MYNHVHICTVYISAVGKIKHIVLHNNKRNHMTYANHKNYEINMCLKIKPMQNQVIPYFETFIHVFETNQNFGEIRGVLFVSYQN